MKKFKLVKDSGDVLYSAIFSDWNLKDGGKAYKLARGKWVLFYSC